MDRNEAKIVNEKIQAAIADVLAEHRLTVKKSSASYDPSDGGGLKLSLTLEGLAPEGLDYNPNSAEAKAFVAYSFDHGIPADRLGTTFVRAGVEYRIIGFRPRARKQPIICAEVGAPDRQTVWTEDGVKSLLGLDGSVAS